MGGGKKTEEGRAMTYVGIVVRRANGPENVARKRDEEAQPHLAHGEEEEQRLLLAHEIILNFPLAPTPALSPTLQCTVHIDEQ
jgi:hypothetical protein